MHAAILRRHAQQLHVGDLVAEPRLSPDFSHGNHQTQLWQGLCQGLDVLAGQSKFWDSTQIILRSLASRDNLRPRRDCSSVGGVLPGRHGALDRIADEEKCDQQLFVSAKIHSKIRSDEGQ
jgi:hypothetical protein